MTSNRDDSEQLASEVRALLHRAGVEVRDVAPAPKEEAETERALARTLGLILGIGSRDQDLVAHLAAGRTLSEIAELTSVPASVLRTRLEAAYRSLQPRDEIVPDHRET